VEAGEAMPLTAVHPKLGTVDASLVTDETWATIHKVRPRPMLTCRGCEGRMQARRSSLGLRFFAHDRTEPTCPSNGETPEHRALKHTIAQAIREANSTAEIEVAPGPGDRGGWRADVLASTPDGRRIAFEAQLASMTTAEGQERTDRYADDGIETVWITTKHASWLFQLPGVRVDDANGIVRATRGCAVFDGERWRTRDDALFGRLIASLLAGRVRPLHLRYLSESYLRGKQSVLKFHDDVVILAPTEQVDRYNEQQKREAEQALVEEMQRARHQQNREALVERQRSILPTAAAKTLRVMPDGHSLWAGIPPAPVKDIRSLTPEGSIGNEATAWGVPLWTGTDKRNLFLQAVVCPVADRITDGLAANWRKRNITVFVETPREDQRLNEKLKWKSGKIHIVGAVPARLGADP
jgi:hypothetical protein